MTYKGKERGEKMANYNIRQTANILGLKVRTIREWIRTGKLKASKYPVSNRWFISDEEIARVMGKESNDNKD